MTTTATPTQYTDLCARLRQRATLGSVGALVAWDQETYMPPGGADARAEQAALLARLVHERATDPALGDLLAECEEDPALSDPSTPEGANLAKIRRDHDKATRLDADLVSELALAQSRAQTAWKQARAASDFASFVPDLTRVMDLTRRKGEALRDETHAEVYDALLDEYEPGATADGIESVFTPLGARLKAFIAELDERGTPPETDFCFRAIPVERQHAFGRRVLEAFGFDFERGRLDTTTHPFCEGLGPGDTRLTTRYSETNFPDAIGSTMHECGHGLYEQGLPKGGDLFGTPLAEAVSLGIHESQSRLWENMVGRSAAFWAWALPIAREMFSPTLDDVDHAMMVRAMNTASPGFIRVEADEATYNLHVMLRFELERALIRGELAIGDLPDAWNTRFEALLGRTVPDDARGCLQDVHWSFGLVGYFPTYTLGNLYAAQMWEAASAAIPDLDDRMARGEFDALLAWLRSNIHQHGRRYDAGELIERISGRPLEPEPLMRHLESRIRPAYGL